MPNLILLPGMDGTDVFFRPFVEHCPSDITVESIEQARAMLSKVRAMVNDLRDRVDRHNAATQAAAAQAPVVFYMGQYVKSDDGLGGES